MRMRYTLFWRAWNKGEPPGRYFRSERPRFAWPSTYRFSVLPAAEERLLTGVPSLCLFPARNLESNTSRAVIQCPVRGVTSSRKQRRNPPSWLYLRADPPGPSTPLRRSQNDSDGIAFSSIESRVAAKYLPLYTRRGKDHRPLGSLFSSLLSWRDWPGSSSPPSSLTI